MRRSQSGKSESGTKGGGTVGSGHAAEQQASLEGYRRQLDEYQKKMKIWSDAYKAAADLIPKPSGDVAGEIFRADSRTMFGRAARDATLIGLVQRGETSQALPGENLGLRKAHSRNLSDCSRRQVIQMIRQRRPLPQRVQRSYGCPASRRHLKYRPKTSRTDNPLPCGRLMSR